MRANEFIKENDVVDKPTVKQEEIIDLYVNYESESYKVVENALKHGTLVSTKGMSKEEFMKLVSSGN